MAGTDRPQHATIDPDLVTIAARDRLSFEIEVSRGATPLHDDAAAARRGRRARAGGAGGRLPVAVCDDTGLLLNYAQTFPLYMCDIFSKWTKKKNKRKRVTIVVRWRPVPMALLLRSSLALAVFYWLVG
ncbi:hypothetical protein EVAR_21301_1 [Eumeta japonica]|uniref:Uncharacterized protein n=1 Tax=Eumeta variegata TaxID=151549 RepID=A0A4C1WMU3_EUMVA|nr:hypothetical protein EVAR_21301_1 [Eumeta japonica]